MEFSGNKLALIFSLILTINATIRDEKIAVLEFKKSKNNNYAGRNLEEISE